MREIARLRLKLQGSTRGCKANCEVQPQLTYVASISVPNVASHVCTKNPGYFIYIMSVQKVTMKLICAQRLFMLDMGASDCSRMAAHGMDGEGRTNARRSKTIILEPRTLLSAQKTLFFEKIGKGRPKWRRNSPSSTSILLITNSLP